ALPGDNRIAEIAAIERAIRLAPLRRDMAVRANVASPESLLVFGVPDPREPTRWNGTVLSPVQIEALLSRALAPIAAGVSYPLMLRDNTGRLLWSGGKLIGRSRVFPSRAISGWELVAGDSGFENSGYRTVFWYAFIALLVVVLLFGLILTMRI